MTPSSQRQRAQQVVVQGIVESYECIGSHSSGLDISSVKTIAKPNGANAVIIQAITKNIRIRLDGQAATASSGFQIQAGQLPIIIAIPGASFSMIQEEATASPQYQWIAQ